MELSWLVGAVLAWLYQSDLRAAARPVHLRLRLEFSLGGAWSDEAPVDGRAGPARSPRTRPQGSDGGDGESTAGGAGGGGRTGEGKEGKRKGKEGG